MSDYSPTAKEVMALRSATGAGMMDCKAALIETGGDTEKATDLLRAKDISLGVAKLSARDSLHVAVMERHGIQTIMSFDRDFDRVPKIVRLHE